MSSELQARHDFMGSHVLLLEGYWLLRGPHLMPVVGRQRYRVGKRIVDEAPSLGNRWRRAEEWAPEARVCTGLLNE